LDLNYWRTGHQHIVFDIGATWFRAALREPDGTLNGFQRRPAVNYINHPDLSPDQLANRLVRYIVDEADRLAGMASKRPGRASISMGAAINGHTGEILNAGPLWGPRSKPFDLLRALSHARGDLIWTVVNDVTALAAYFASANQSQGADKISVLTVSTGIASRTIEIPRRRVPLQRKRGVQGEIGHTPVLFRPHGVELDLRCDCGGMSHLNAYCSGRGIPRVMKGLAATFQQPQWEMVGGNEDPANWVNLLRAGLNNIDSAAVDLLDFVTEPLARSIIAMLTVDPEVERVIVTGGVPDALGPVYRQSLIRNLEATGLYMVSDHDPEYFKGTVGFADDAAHAGIHGAALAAENLEAVAHSPRQPSSALLSGGHRRTAEMLKISYDVTMADPSMGNSIVDALRAVDGSHQPVVIADNAVADIYGDALMSKLRRAQYEPVLQRIQAGEKAKRGETVRTILDIFESVGVSRRQHPVVAFGGGALLDTVGLAAGLFRRGVPYIRIPTSLVGLIDAGVGVKVGVNAYGHKNRIGLFYPPRSVILDVSFLTTLPARYILSGVAEMIKIAVVGDSALFDWLESSAARLSSASFYQTSRGRDIIARAADAMIDSLEGNLWEESLERAADFGHSVSQLFEVADQTVTHGEAVSIDMALSLEIGRQRGVTPPPEAERVMGLLQKVGLPIWKSGVTEQDIGRALEETHRHRGGHQRLPLVTSVGERPFFANDITQHEAMAAWIRLETRWRS